MQICMSCICMWFVTWPENALMYVFVKISATLIKLNWCLDAFPLIAAPCAATNVTAKLETYNGTGEIFWSAARGAISYMVTAAATNGHQASCETDELQCELSELQCGQTYKVKVITNNDLCQTETQTNVSLSTCESRYLFKHWVSQKLFYLIYGSNLNVWARSL